MKKIRFPKILSWVLFRSSVATMIFLMTITPALSQEVYTNKTILDLKTAGLSKDVMKNMIASAPNCKFETDAQNVIKLKKAGIDDEVINAMITKMNPGATTKPVGNASTDTKMPGMGKANLDNIKAGGSGIYYQNNSEFREVEPTVYSGRKESANVWKDIPGVKTTVRYTLNGKTAQITANEKKPVFYFVFKSTSDNLNDQGSGWLREVSGPNEFQLVKVIVKVDKKTGKNESREIETNGSSYYGGKEAGVPAKFKVDFKRRKLEEGIYEIYFDEDLAPGEYCFMYAGANMDLNSKNPKVYDFAIK